VPSRRFRLSESQTLQHTTNPVSWIVRRLAGLFLFHSKEIPFWRSVEFGRQFYCFRKDYKGQESTSPIRPTARIISRRINMRRNNVKSMVDGNVHNGVSPDGEDPDFPQICDLTLNGDRALKTSWTLKKMDSDKTILFLSFNSPTKSCTISSLLS